MFRDKARACYPESSPADGCFPANDTTPSRFKCWMAGSPDAPRPADLLSLLSPEKDGRRPDAERSGRRR
jgi:hypothetical protein